MSIKEILKKNFSIEIELLLSHVLGKPKEFLYLHPEKSLSSHQVKSLSSLIKRREKGEPVAYILGYKDFMGQRFKVSKDVLIPRPETEWLVERVVGCVIPSEQTGNLQGESRNLYSSPHINEKRSLHSSKILYLKNFFVGRDDTLKILDLGTGSGCIAISLAKQLNDVNITAADISSAALKIAQQNAKILLKDFSNTTKYKKNLPRLQFIRSDLFENVKGKFDIVVANLPYIPLKILHRYLLHKSKLSPTDPFAGLKYEPPHALTDGSSIWLIYKRFFEQVRGHLNPGALILLEIDPASRKFLTDYQKKYLAKARIKFYKDFNGFWRYAEIKK